MFVLLPDGAVNRIGCPGVVQTMFGGTGCRVMLILHYSREFLASSIGRIYIVYLDLQSWIGRYIFL